MKEGQVEDRRRFDREGNVIQENKRSEDQEDQKIELSRRAEAFVNLATQINEMNRLARDLGGALERANKDLRLLAENLTVEEREAVHKALSQQASVDERPGIGFKSAGPTRSSATRTSNTIGFHPHSSGEKSLEDSLSED